MRQLNAIPVALTQALLLVILPTVAFARPKQIDLTGTWILRGSTPITIDERGCTAGSAARVFIDDEEANQDAEVTVEQRGNQIIRPSSEVTYTYPGGGSGSYTLNRKGTISGNKVRLTDWANTSFGEYTIVYLGTVSNDGNTVTWRSVCRATAGPAIANGTSVWIRKN